MTKSEKAGWREKGAREGALSGILTHTVICVGPPPKRREARGRHDPRAEGRVSPAPEKFRCHASLTMNLMPKGNCVPRDRGGRDASFLMSHGDP